MIETFSGLDTKVLYHTVGVIDDVDPLLCSAIGRT